MPHLHLAGTTVAPTPLAQSPPAKCITLTEPALLHLKKMRAEKGDAAALLRVGE